MASPLAVGAGASSGLDDFLHRLMLEQQQGEVARHNLADEGLRGRQIDESAADRKAREADLDFVRRQTLKDKESAAVNAKVNMRGIGDTVTPEEMKTETGAGIPSSLYDVKPGAQVSALTGFSSLPDVGSSLKPPTSTTPQMSSIKLTSDASSPLNAPPTITNKGTELQRQTAGKNNDTSYRTYQQLTDAAQKLEMQGKVNEANIARAQAQAELDRVKALHAGDAKPLPASTSDAMAGMNVAEVEGVKVLSTLHQAGLDQSNDPADPRWQKFMVTTLKMAPADWQKADIQQRTAAINAMLTRGLMGARPSQYVAQIIQQHLPQGDMTGRQLSHVLHNVLQQAGERRTETESLTSRPAGSLAPKSGKTYRQYLDELGSGGTDADPLGVLGLLGKPKG